MKKILVTGSAGFNCANLVKRLFKDTTEGRSTRARTWEG